MKRLHPRAVWLFFFRNLFLTIFAVVGYSIIVWTSTNFKFLLPPALIIAALAGILFAYAWAVLQYRFYRYGLAKDGFKKESGVIYKRYVTIPYGRIQNVDIYRALIHRILGLSELYIQTAGMSYVGTRTRIVAEGQLTGLSREEAEKVRDELIKRVNAIHEQGL